MFDRNYELKWVKRASLFVYLPLTKHETAEWNDIKFAWERLEVSQQSKDTEKTTESRQKHHPDLLPSRMLGKTKMKCLHSHQGDSTVQTIFPPTDFPRKVFGILIMELLSILARLYGVDDFFLLWTSHKKVIKAALFHHIVKTILTSRRWKVDENIFPVAFRQVALFYIYSLLSSPAPTCAHTAIKEALSSF